MLTFKHYLDTQVPFDRNLKFNERWIYESVDDRMLF